MKNLYGINLDSESTKYKDILVGDNKIDNAVVVPVLRRIKHIDDQTNKKLQDELLGRTATQEASAGAVSQIANQAKN